MCSRTLPVKFSLSRKATNTATPPNGVTAREVSRKTTRFPEKSALISRRTGLSAASGSIL
jgi:hypothetical protein